MESEREAVAGRRAKRRQRIAEEGAELLTGYDNMACVDDTGAPTSRRKLYCPECGLARDPELAERLACVCGGRGTQKRPPQFDEFGELIPAEVVAERNAERLRALQAGRAAARAAQAEVEQPRPPQQVLVEDHPKSDAAKAVKAILQRAHKPKPVARPAAPASTQDMFLLMAME